MLCRRRSSLLFKFYCSANTLAVESNAFSNHSQIFARTHWSQSSSMISDALQTTYWVIKTFFFVIFSFFWYFGFSPPHSIRIEFLERMDERNVNANVLINWQRRIKRLINWMAVIYIVTNCARCHSQSLSPESEKKSAEDTAACSAFSWHRVWVQCITYIIIMNSEYTASSIGSRTKNDRSAQVAHSTSPARICPKFLEN